MRDCKPFDESEIRWKELSAASQSESWSHTGRSIGMLQYKWFRLRSFVPDRESKTLLECINFCIDNYEQLVSPAQSKEFIDSESDIDDDVDSQADRINDEDLEIIF